MVASADTIIDGTAEHGKQNKVEDGQFGVFIPLTDEQEKEITDKGITLEQHFSIDVTAKDGSKLRVFRKRNDIDLIELDSGRLAEKKGEAVVEKRYSEEHSLSVGDKLTAGGVEFEIVGIGTTPDGTLNTILTTLGLDPILWFDVTSRFLQTAACVHFHMEIHRL